ncbi:MAG: ATP-binding cassette domain-containing protein, partial [Chromatiales bacterium]|nr:ATP-binding cassette domain-containing protein [Chromatiales bacterium]
DRVKQQCGLGDCGGRLIGNLSKGYQQRTGIAQAIIHDPALVILDEPTNGLDPNQIREIRTLIRELGESRGIILSTHILSEVQAICSRVLILNRGELVYSADMQRFTSEQQPALLLGLANPPALSELSQLPGITEVNEIDGNRFLLNSHEQLNPTAIAQHCLAQDWQLEELSPQREELEQIFTRLTSTEVTA